MIYDSYFWEIAIGHVRSNRLKHFRNQFVLGMDSNFIRSPYLIVPEDLLGLQDQNHDLMESILFYLANKV